MFRAFLLVSTCAAALGAPPLSFAGGDESSHVRFSNERIAEMFRFAADRSATFRGLVRALEASGGIVYLGEGKCMEGRLHSCVHVAAAPPARYVMVRVDPREQVLSVVAALAHELQHAVEISTAPDIVDAASVERLYARIGFANCPSGFAPCWETREAQDVEQRVVHDVQRPPSTTAEIDGGFFGSWTLNVARSLFEDGETPASSCLITSDRAFGLISSVTTTVDREGQSYGEAFVFRLDGREYQMTAAGERPRRTISATPVDPFDAEFVIRQDGDVVATGRWILARDGQTLIVQTLRFDDDGKDSPSVAVWDKQRVKRE